MAEVVVVVELLLVVAVVVEVLLSVAVEFEKMLIVLIVVLDVVLEVVADTERALRIVEAIAVLLFGMVKVEFEAEFLDERLFWLGVISIFALDIVDEPASKLLLGPASTTEAADDSSTLLAEVEFSSIAAGFSP